MHSSRCFYVLNILRSPHSPIFFFFNDTATTEIYTLSLHDALPICGWARDSESRSDPENRVLKVEGLFTEYPNERDSDRKSTRLNSSHLVISYAVFCLKKKKMEKHGNLKKTRYLRLSTCPSCVDARY